MSENEKIAKIEKEIAEIKDYQKKLEKATKEGFDSVMGLIDSHTNLIKKILHRMDYLDIDIKRSDELLTNLDKRSTNSDEVIEQLTEKLKEIQQWKNEIMNIITSLVDLEKSRVDRDKELIKKFEKL